MAKEEIKDMEEEYRRERDDLWAAVRDVRKYNFCQATCSTVLLLLTSMSTFVLGRQIKLKDLIIKNFISQEQAQEMHTKAVWDDDIGDWIVGAETTIDLYSYKRPTVRLSICMPTQWCHRLASKQLQLKYLLSFAGRFN